MCELNNQKYKLVNNVFPSEQTKGHTRKNIKKRDTKISKQYKVKYKNRNIGTSDRSKMKHSKVSHQLRICIFSFKYPTIQHILKSL